MISRGQSLPDEVVDEWPEVFNEVTLNVLPIQYVQAIRIYFTDGKIWEIGIENSSTKKERQAFHKEISVILDNYDDVIDQTDFKINTTKVRQDVERAITKMLNRINL